MGTLNSFSLTLSGTCGGGGGTARSGSATPNLATIDNDSACTSLTVGTTGGDSAAAKLDISGRHDFRSILRGTLAHNGTTVAAFPTGTFASGSGTFAFTSRAVAGLSGDAGGRGHCASWTPTPSATPAHSIHGQSTTDMAVPLFSATAYFSSRSVSDVPGLKVGDVRGCTSGSASPGSWRVTLAALHA